MASGPPSPIAACAMEKPVTTLTNTRLVLFDAGNTLLHLDHAFIADLLRARGRQVTALQVQEAEYAGKRWVDALFAGRDRGDDEQRRGSYFSVILETLGIGEDEGAAAVEDLHAANAAECLWRVVAADTPAVLGRLRERGFVLGVISNADGRIEADLARRNLRPYFDTVVDSAVVGVEKPDRRIFELTLARLGKRPEEAVYVGDVYSIDVAGAEAAGLRAVLIDPLDRYGRSDCLRIRGLAELLSLLPERAA